MTVEKTDILDAGARTRDSRYWFPFITALQLVPGKIIASESTHVRGDPTCCTSARATTVCPYRAGRLRPGRTTYARTAARTPRAACTP